MSAKPHPPFDEPMTAKPIDGEVAITGPGHIHGSMTPAAAKDSAAHLQEVADSAERQGASAPEEGAEDNPG